MKCVLFLTVLIVVICVAASHKCPATFQQEENKYVLRLTCYKISCDPVTGNFGAVNCPPAVAPTLSPCKMAALKAEGCHEGWVADNTEVYSYCCPVYKNKICKGDPGFDASKVPIVASTIVPC
ncbi:uncharacterized protein LOC135499254 [Lineus longissimus]|uniref:uncharacterized protein LOC135499254 n=1 Tax=Lineus longissimus TaxID=88925 RepID=UPI002B4EDD41